MLEPQEVTVNGQPYVVHPFGPMEAHQFLHDLIIARGTGVGLASLGMQAIKHCLTPELKNLSNVNYFSEWFGAHPGDMLELEAKAIDALIEPWERTKKEQEGTE